MTTAGAIHIGYRLTPAATGFAVDPLRSDMHRSDRSRIEVRDAGSVRVGFGIALVLAASIDEGGLAAAVRYALPYAEIVEDGSPIFVLGNPPTDPGEIDPGSVRLTVTLDGREVPLARPSLPADPPGALARLAGEATAMPPGAFILTGWLTELTTVEPGFVAADLGAAGRVSCRIAEPGTPVADDRPPWGETIEPVGGRSPISIGPFVDVYDPADGELEPWCLNDHCFVKGADDIWHVFGITHVKPYNHALDPGTRLAHATATSLEQRGWQKQPFALVADPSLDEHLLWAPHVVERDGTFHMFVCVGAASGDLFSIRRYESDDLWSWRRTHAPPPVVDGVEARDPMVLRDGDGWILYYTATERPDGGRFVVAAVTSHDLVNWSSRRVVFTHPRMGAFGGPTESPFVVRRGPAYYLFVTDDEVVHAYASRDPFSWSVEDHVLAYRGRACEVVRNETGAWFISHVGWELGGLALAPVEWHDGFDHEPASIEPAA